MIFCFRQKTAYEVRISDWSSDVCSSDLNASGNWIKIVQRAPVRIALDPRELDKYPLRIGLSVNVKVDTSDISDTLIGKPAKEAFSRQASVGEDPAVEARIAQIIAANRGSTE